MIVSCLEQSQVVVTMEEHALAGGFGSAVLELANHCGMDSSKLLRIGIGDDFVPLENRIAEAIIRTGCSAYCRSHSAAYGKRAGVKSDMAKQRLDVVLVEKGMAASREKAKALIMAGKVLVDNKKIDKAGTEINPELPIRLLGQDIPYVSRGGLKLEKALQVFPVDLHGKDCGRYRRFYRRVC